MKVWVSICAIFCSTFWSLSDAASDFSGTVRAIEVHKGFGGVFIQLDAVPHFEIGSACQFPWAFVPISDQFFSHYLAIATTAKATGETVRIFTNGCVSTPHGLLPAIAALDYGVRAPGT